jgi:hypothetical protein
VDHLDRREQDAGGTIDHGTYGSQKNPPYQAVDWALDQYRFVRDNTGVPRAGTSSFTRSRIRIEWPESDWPSHNYRYNTNNGNVLEEEIQLPPRVNNSCTPGHE